MSEVAAVSDSVVSVSASEFSEGSVRVKKRGLARLFQSLKKAGKKPSDLSRSPSGSFRASPSPPTCTVAAAAAAVVVTATQPSPTAPRIAAAASSVVTSMAAATTPEPKLRAAAHPFHAETVPDKCPKAADDSAARCLGVMDVLAKARQQGLIRGPDSGGSAGLLVVKENSRTTSSSQDVGQINVDNERAAAAHGNKKRAIIPLEKRIRESIDSDWDVMGADGAAETNGSSSHEALANTPERILRASSSRRQNSMDCPDVTPGMVSDIVSNNIVANGTCPASTTPAPGPGLALLHSTMSFNEGRSLPTSRPTAKSFGKVSVGSVDLADKMRGMQEQIYALTDEQLQDSNNNFSKLMSDGKGSSLMHTASSMSNVLSTPTVKVYRDLWSQGEDDQLIRSTHLEILAMDLSNVGGQGIQGGMYPGGGGWAPNQGGWQGPRSSSLLGGHGAGGSIQFVQVSQGQLVGQSDSEQMLHAISKASVSASMYGSSLTPPSAKQGPNMSGTHKSFLLGSMHRLSSGGGGGGYMDPTVPSMQRLGYGDTSGDIVHTYVDAMRTGGSSLQSRSLPPITQEFSSTWYTQSTPSSHPSRTFPVGTNDLTSSVQQPHERFNIVTALERFQTMMQDQSENVEGVTHAAAHDASAGGYAIGCQTSPLDGEPSGADGAAWNASPEGWAPSPSMTRIKEDGQMPQQPQLLAQGGRHLQKMNSEAALRSGWQPRSVDNLKCGGIANGSQSESQRLVAPGRDRISQVPDIGKAWWTSPQELPESGVQHELMLSPGSGSMLGRYAQSSVGFAAPAGAGGIGMGTPTLLNSQGSIFPRRDEWSEEEQALLQHGWVNENEEGGSRIAAGQVSSKVDAPAASSTKIRRRSTLSRDERDMASQGHASGRWAGPLSGRQSLSLREMQPHLSEDQCSVEPSPPRGSMPEPVLHTNDDPLTRSYPNFPEMLLILFGSALMLFNVAIIVYVLVALKLAFLQQKE